MHITALITTLLATASITAYGKLAVDSGYVSSVIDALKWVNIPGSSPDSTRMWDWSKFGLTVDNSEANFTALAGALQKIDGTTEGAAFFARVTDQNIKTWLAPTNEVSAADIGCCWNWQILTVDYSLQAFARAPESILSNTTVLADILS
jgi:hypothetical protein